MEFKKGHISWNRGLTKELDERIKKHSKNLCGRKYSEESKKKMSLARLGRKYPRLSESKKRLFAEGRLINWNKGLPKEMQPMYGKKQSEKHKQRLQSYGHRQLLSKIMKGRKLSEETKEKLRKIPHCNKCGRFRKNIHVCGFTKQTEISKQKISEIRKKQWKDPLSKYNSQAYRDKFRLLQKEGKIGMRGKQQTARQIEAIRKTGQKNKGRKHTKEEIEKIRELWKNPRSVYNSKEYREKLTKSILQGNRPTSLERKFIEFIEKYSLPLIYCGNGSLLIGYKNPDFVESNGRKLCMEVAYSPLKSLDYEKRRVEHFNKFGWKCLILLFDGKDNIWIKDENEILNKINNFMQEGYNE